MPVTHASDTVAGALEPQVRERVLALLFDYLSVAMRGAASPPATAARSALVHTRGGARVIGTELRAPSADAALVNGVAAHAIELEDTYEPASTHPGAAIWPAVLAVAEERDATFGAVLRAAVAGYDAACLAGDLLDPAETYARGFHPTGVCGPLGAAEAVCELLGLDAEARAHAAGVAASAAGGLLAFLADGAWTKPLHAGQAASAGVRAAFLAAAGYRGPRDVMAGPYGFLQAFGGREEPPSGPVAGAGRGAGVMSTAIKPYACCRYSHGCIGLLIELAREKGLVASDIEGVRCAVLQAGWHLVAGPPERKRRIESQVDAQFSLPFAAAVSLDRHRLTLDDFESADERAVPLADLIARVECYRSERLESAFPAAWGAEIQVSLRSGESYTRAVADAPGSPARPLSRTALLDKSADLVGHARAEALLVAGERASDEMPISDITSNSA